MYAVTFDVDDTLVRIDPAVRAEAHRRALQDVGINLPVGVCEVRGVVWDTDTVRRLPNTVWEMGMHLTGSRTPSTWVDRYVAALENAWRGLIDDGAEVQRAPGLVELLDRLDAEAFQFGVISEDNEAIIRRKLEAVGVAFDTDLAAAFGDLPKERRPEIRAGGLDVVADVLNVQHRLLVGREAARSRTR